MSKHYLLLISISCTPYTQPMNLISPLSDSLNVTEIINNELLDNGLTQEQIDAINNIAQEHYQEKLEEWGANIKEDLDVITIAASLTGSLEILNKIIKIAGIEQAHVIIRSIKDAARINVLHKLVMGANPGKFANSSLYTNAKTETLGFTLNNVILSKAVECIAKTKFGKWIADNLYLEKMHESASWIGQKVFVGLVTHLVWSGQKALWKSSQSMTS